MVTDQFFVGHLGRTDFLAAATFCNTLFNFVWCALLGASTALDTLASQAHGAGDHAALITWTFASLWVLSALTLPAAAVMWFAWPLAVALFGQGAGTAAAMGSFCRRLIPGMWPMVGSVCVCRCVWCVRGRVEGECTG